MTFDPNLISISTPRHFLGSRRTTEEKRGCEGKFQGATANLEAPKFSVKIDLQEPIDIFTCSVSSFTAYPRLFRINISSFSTISSLTCQRVIFSSSSVPFKAKTPFENMCSSQNMMPTCYYQPFKSLVSGFPNFRTTSHANSLLRTLVLKTNPTDTAAIRSVDMFITDRYKICKGFWINCVKYLKHKPKSEFFLSRCCFALPATALLLIISQAPVQPKNFLISNILALLHDRVYCV